MLLLAAFFLMLLIFSGTALGTGQGNCLESSDMKYDGPGPIVVDAPVGEVFTEVAIKSGVNIGCRFYDADTNDGCYSVSGIGTGTLTVEKIGSGPECQDISHIEVVYGVPSGGGELGGDEPGDGGESDNGDTKPGDNASGEEYLTSESGGQQTSQTTADPQPAATTVTVTSLASTGLELAIPLTGLGMAATGFMIRRRKK